MKAPQFVSSSNTLMEAILVTLLLIIFHIPSMEGEIQTIEISSDPRSFIMLEDFGFSEGGRVSVSLSNSDVSISSKASIHSSMSRIGFFYAPSSVSIALIDALFNDSCILGNPSVFPIFTLKELHESARTSINRTVLITDPDFYYIFALNCAPETSISMQAKLETYTFTPDGHRDFINEQCIISPTIGLVLSSVCLAFMVAWLVTCCRNRPFVRKIHILMLALLLSKSLELFSRDRAQDLVRLTGTPHSWDITWMVLYFIRTMMFCVVFTLIGSGWSLTTLSLQNTQKLVLVSSVLLQTLVNVCFVFTRLQGPLLRNYSYWVVTFYVVDLLSSMWVVFPVSHTINELREASNAEGNNEARKSAQLRAFLALYACLQAYVYLEKFGMFVLRAFLNYESWWISVVLEHVIDNCVLMVAYYVFQPSEKNNNFVYEDRHGEEELVPLSSLPPIV